MLKKKVDSSGSRSGYNSLVMLRIFILGRF